MTKLAILLAILLCGCATSNHPTATAKVYRCTVPEAATLEQWADAHKFHLLIEETSYAFRYHVHLWPKSGRDWPFSEWAYAGVSDNLSDAIKEAQTAAEEDHKTWYSSEHWSKTICKK